MLTLGQAAKETGLAKSAISRAIKSGRISAVRKENGSFEIDPAELFRVYPRNSTAQREEERTATHSEPNGLHREIAVLRELIDEIKGERDDLRTERDRLLSVIQEQAGTVKQLTHQNERQPQAAANQNAPAAKPPAVRPWLWVALAAVIITATVWLAYGRPLP
jgi:septal ring factor EnvC (AmiA/AmiB activator)